jgi:Zn-dependent peptidase ImmA (M78 family)
VASVVGSTNDAIDAAAKLIDQYHTHDPFKIAKNIGVVIRWQYLGNTIMGYSLHTHRIPNIVLNVQSSDLTNIAVCGHELGHCILHKDFDTNFFSRIGAEPMVGDTEYEANCFMFELIFGDKEVSPMNYNAILDSYNLPHWMWQYFSLVTPK